MWYFICGYIVVFAAVACSSSQRQCAWGMCVSANRFCDGVNDCNDWSDEYTVHNCGGMFDTSTFVYVQPFYTFFF